MFTGRKKIVKAKGAEPDPFEQSVAQELFNLEMSQGEIKQDLQNLHITAAKEVEIQGGKKAIVIFVPYKLLQQYHKIQSRLVRELEKKFSGKHVVIIAQRTIYDMSYSRKALTNGPRPRSRTLKAVQEAILEVSFV